MSLDCVVPSVANNFLEHRGQCIDSPAVWNPDLKCHWGNLPILMAVMQDSVKSCSRGHQMPGELPLEQSLSGHQEGDFAISSLSFCEMLSFSTSYISLFLMQQKQKEPLLWGSLSCQGEFIKCEGRSISGERTGSCNSLAFKRKLLGSFCSDLNRTLRSSSSFISTYITLGKWLGLWVSHPSPTSLVPGRVWSTRIQQARQQDRGKWIRVFAKRVTLLIGD